MKGRGHQFVLTYGHGLSVGQRGHYVNFLSNPYDSRSAYKHSMEGDLVELVDGEVLLEAVYLASESVAKHTDVHKTQRNRVFLGDLLGHHYHPGASAPNGLTFVGHSGDRLPEIINVHQATQGGAFTPWDDQPVYVRELVGQSYFPSLHSQSLQYGNMLGKVSLYR